MRFFSTLLLTSSLVTTLALAPSSIVVAQTRPIVLSAPAKPQLGPEPAPEGPSLQDYASKLKSLPREKRPAGGFSARVDPQVKISGMNAVPGGGGVDVSGLVTNLTRQRVWLWVVLEGSTPLGGRKHTWLGSREGEPLDPGGSMPFAGHLGDCDPYSVVAYALTKKELGGSIESSEERKLRECLTFQVAFPSDRSQPGRSLEVRAKNSCTLAVPPEKTWFRVAVRNAIKDLVATRTDQFREAIPARGEARRELTVSVPADAIVTIESYSPES